MWIFTVGVSRDIDRMLASIKDGLEPSRACFHLNIFSKPNAVKHAWEEFFKSRGFEVAVEKKRKAYQ